MLTFFRKYFIGSKTGDLHSDCPAGRSPLAACPGSPNCIRVSRKTGSPPDELFTSVLNALKQMKAEEISPDTDRHRADAVFRIPVFGFRDDLSIAIESEAEGSMLHIRSASREGYGDLGVNRRRVKKLLKLLEL